MSFFKFSFPDYIEGTPVPVPIHPSKVMITKLYLDRDRKQLLELKRRPEKSLSDIGEMDVDSKNVGGGLNRVAQLHANFVFQTISLLLKNSYVIRREFLLIVISTLIKGMCNISTNYKKEKLLCF